MPIEKRATKYTRISDLRPGDLFRAVVLRRVFQPKEKTSEIPGLYWFEGTMPSGKLVFLVIGFESEGLRETFNDRNDFRKIKMVSRGVSREIIDFVGTLACKISILRESLEIIAGESENIREALNETEKL